MAGAGSLQHLWLEPEAGISALRAVSRMSTLTAPNRKPGRDDRDFVEIPIPMRGTASELA
jgi:hypothetical protein